VLIVVLLLYSTVNFSASPWFGTDRPGQIILRAHRQNVIFIECYQTAVLWILIRIRSDPGLFCLFGCGLKIKPRIRILNPDLDSDSEISKCFLRVDGDFLVHEES
jgi:hypothetical protein